MSESPSTPIAGSVIIDPSYFERAINDYSEPGWALIREVVQNGRDARGTTRIEVNYDSFLGTFDVHNNGEPMDRDVLFGKFLALGGSAKNFGSGSVGGFGRAKELYFCQRSWRVETGEFSVVGVGGNFTHTEGHSFEGTRSVISLHPRFDALSYHIRKFLSLCDWEGTVVFNGEVMTTKLKAGKEQCSYDWGRIYTQNHPELNGMCVVRVKGIPMFWRIHGGPELVVVEIEVPSVEALVSSRDGFKYPHCYDFTSFIENLGRDRLRALRRKWEIMEYSGDTVKVHTRESTTSDKNAPPSLTVVEESVVETESAVTTSQLLRASSMAARIVTPPKEEEEKSPHNVTITGDEIVEDVLPHVLAHIKERQEEEITVMSSNIPHKVGHRFYTANNTGCAIPEWFTPVGMGRYCLQVATAWLEALVIVHGIMGKSGEFSIGFLFSEDAEAMWDPKVKCYFINPVVLVRQAGNADAFSFKKRYLPHKDRFKIMANAAHEILHVHGYPIHDEKFANVLTDLTASLLENYKNLTPKTAVK